MDNLRPQRLDEFIGQEKTRKILELLCKSAKNKKTAVSHVLLSGPPGLGKTTLARIIAQEMGSRLIETVGGNIQSPEQLVGRLKSLREFDVLFIDEIHALPRSVEEILYSAMEDRQVPVTKTEGANFMKALGVSIEPVVETLHLPHYSLVGASTMAGLVSAPLRSRFAHVLTLDPYAIEDLTSIVMRASKTMGFELYKEAAAEIARRSRSTARTAISHLQWVTEYCSGMGVHPDMGAVLDAFAMTDIDDYGLTAQDRRYLEILVRADQPVGLSTISMTLNETIETIEQAMEPHLIREGLIRRAPRGRVALEKAKEFVCIGETESR